MARGGEGARAQKQQSDAHAAEAVPVVVMGLGFIGQEIARCALQSEELEVIGAVDKSPGLVGKKLTDVLGMPAGTFKVQRVRTGLAFVSIALFLVVLAMLARLPTLTG